MNTTIFPHPAGPSQNTMSTETFTAPPRFDVHVLPALHEWLTDRLDRNPGRVNIDLSQVSFMDLHIIETLSSVEEELLERGISMKLQNASTATLITFELVRSDVRMMNQAA